MKAKMFTNKAFSLVFCLTVVLFVCCMSFSAFAVETECTHPNLKENNWIVTKAPTCTESGTKEQECKSCKKVVEYTIAPDTEAHLLDAWEQVASSSCSQTGLKVRKCVYCEKVIESEVIPAHNYSVLYGDDATCMRTGYQLKMCMDCYDMITVNIPIKEDAHVYSDWVITEEATCVNESGSRVKTCLNTDENGKPCTSEIVERFSDEDNHPSITWRDNEKKAPTCEKDGYTPGTCDKCHAEVKKIHPKHSESQVLRDDTVLEPTCNSVGIKRCLCICGLEYDVEIPVSEDAHVYNEWYVQKEADCTAGKRVRYCIYHPSVTLEQTIPATGEHVYGEWEVTVQPDCTTTGLRVKECASCKDKIEEVLPVYHVYGSWKTTKDMSCEEGNLKTGEKVATCNYCTYTKKFSVPAIHNFCEWYVKELADCKTGNHGIMQRYCENCNEFEYKNYEVEHDFTPWVVTITPVCADKDKGTTGKTGVYTRWCRTCKTAEEKAIPVTHEYETAEILEYPTCTDSGSENLVCKFCDKIIENNMIPALGHNYGEWVVTKPAN